MSSDQFRHFDFKFPKADGTYVEFTKVERPDSDASPMEWLDENNPDDADRIAAWNRDDFSMVGIQARADIMIVRNNVGTTYSLTSAGLWGIESDSDASYFDEVFKEQCEELRVDILAMGSAQFK